MYILLIASMVFVVGWVGVGLWEFPTGVAFFDIAASIAIGVSAFGWREKKHDVSIARLVGGISLAVIVTALAGHWPFPLLQVIQGCVGLTWLTLAVALFWPAVRRLIEGKGEQRLPSDAV